MADWSTFQLQYNNGTDASPTWTGQALQFGTAGNELRWCPTGGNGSTSSANWPFFTRPASVQAVPELWAFVADTSGLQVKTYDGTNTKARVLRWDWSGTGGTFAAAPQFSAFGSTAHSMTTAEVGVQPGQYAGSQIVNGQASDTGGGVQANSTSYLKINAFGYGVDTGGVQQTPNAGSAGTTLAATSGSSGAVSPNSGAWLSIWQSAQGWLQYIQDGVVPGGAGDWYWTLALYTGPGMVTGTITPVVTMQYSYS